MGGIEGLGLASSFKFLGFFDSAPTFSKNAQPWNGVDTSRPVDLFCWSFLRLIMEPRCGSVLIYSPLEDRCRQGGAICPGGSTENLEVNRFSMKLYLDLHDKVPVSGPSLFATSPTLFVDEGFAVVRGHVESVPPFQLSGVVMTGSVLASSLLLVLRPMLNPVTLCPSRPPSVLVEPLF